jgi:hypothetical protein
VPIYLPNKTSTREPFGLTKKNPGNSNTVKKISSADHGILMAIRPNRPIAKSTNTRSAIMYPETGVVSFSLFIMILN